MAFSILVLSGDALWRKIISETIKRAALSSGVTDSSIVLAASIKIASERISAIKPELAIIDGTIDFNELKLFVKKISSENPSMMMLLSLPEEISDQSFSGAKIKVIRRADGMIESDRRLFSEKELLPAVNKLIRQLSVSSVLKTRNVESIKKGSADKASNKSKDSGTVESSFNCKKSSITRINRAGLIVIGISTGGPEALNEMLPKLPANIGIPVIIVQHMPMDFTRSLAQALDNICPLKVKEAEDGEYVRSGVVYISPGGKQMKISKSIAGRISIIINDDPPENNCRPSVDYLFRSVANHFPGGVCAVIMTGMGNDGTKGLRQLKSRGAVVSLAQDRESSIVYGMPGEAVKAGLIDDVVPLQNMAEAILSAIGYRKASDES